MPQQQFLKRLSQSPSSMSYGQCIAPGCKSRGIRASKDCVIPDSTFRYLCPSAATPIGNVHDGCRNRIRKATPAKRAELWRQYQAEQSSADDSDDESTSSSLPEEITAAAASTSMTATVVPQLHSAFDHPNFWRTHPQRDVAPISIRSLIPYANPEHTLVIPVDVTLAPLPLLPLLAPTAAATVLAPIAPLAKSSSSSSSSSSLPSPPPPRGEKRKRSPSPSSPLIVDSPVIAAADDHQQINGEQEELMEAHQPLSPPVLHRPTVKEWAEKSSLPVQTAVFDVITLAFKSGESEVLKIYCHQPGQATSSMRFIAKHYHSEAMRQQESRIFARLYYANDRALQDVDRFIRQRLKPSFEFRKLFATELYTQFGVDTGDHGKLKSKQEIPIQKKHHRSIGQAAVAATAHLPPLDPATQAIQHFRQMKTLVAFFSFYRGVMMDAICRRCKDYPIDAEGERRRVDLRMTLFWHPRSNDPEHGDYSEMMNKSLRFVLHCLEGLDMHHRSHVLIGDIKPSNLFYGAQMDRNLHDANFCPLPVFGDYGHATDLTSKESSSHVLTLYSLSSMSGQVKHKHIGTWPYQAPETHSAAAGRVGIFDRSSDLFALALTILEILTGQLFQKAHDRLETDRSQYACKNAPGQSDSQFYSDAQEWIGTSLTSLWINSVTASDAHVSVDELSQLKWNEQRTALIPSAITDLLLQMLHTDRNKRPTVQAAIAQVRSHIEESY